MMNEHKLNEYCSEMAAEILADAIKYNDGDMDVARDAVYERADGSEYVIYYHKAHELCQNCNTDNGEDWVSDFDIKPQSYHEFATKLAFGEIVSRVSIELETLIGEYEYGQETEYQGS